MRPSPILYDIRRGMLRPDYTRIADAHYIKRDPVTDEVSWPPHRMEEQLKELRLIYDWQIA